MGLLDAAESILRANTWDFERMPDGGAIGTVIEGPPRYALVVAADDERELITCFAVLTELVAEEHRDEVLRLLNRANHGIEVVSFEMDEADGEVRARATVPVYGEPLVETHLVVVLSETIFHAARVFPQVTTLGS